MPMSDQPRRLIEKKADRLLTIVRKQGVAIRSLRRQINLLRLTDRLDALSARVAELETKVRPE